jgi:drug/metabolite transporter (DMT)-like permease
LCPSNQWVTGLGRNGAPTCIQPAFSSITGIVCGTGAALFWAAGFAGARHGLDIGFSAVDLAVHRFLWAGLALLPLVIRNGIGDLDGVGWRRGVVLTVLVGPGFSILSYSGFLLVPLGHGGVIQPACVTLGGLILATLLLKETLAATRPVGALIIVCGLLAIGIETMLRVGVHAVPGDLLFVAAGLMFATFGTLLRLWRIAPMPATAVINVLSLFVVPAYALAGGFEHMVSLGWRENLLQAVLQGMLSGPAAQYLFVQSVVMLGAGRAAVFPSLVPPFVLLIGWLALGEMPTALELTGLTLVLIGFRFAQRG